jgi:tRNA1(Val) A37 N6-methylase TrmN6
MTENIDILRLEASNKLDQEKRGELGQFFTSSAIARFMASLFTRPTQNEITLLDAGAGIGVLTLAFLDRAKKEFDQVNTITTTAYEIDKTLIEYLNDNLVATRQSYDPNKQLLSFIIDADFIEDSVEGIVKKDTTYFTHAILNPPYKKIHSQSGHRKFLRLVDFETVNLYSAFVGLSLLRLSPGGELVAIIPRSFCNGNYYKGFRELIIQNATISRIHVFNSRTQAFKDDDILQENVIIHFKKVVSKENVIVTSSTDETFADLTERIVSYHEIIKPGDNELFIHIPTNESSLESTPGISYTLNDLSVKVSTGPVVDFRTKDNLHQDLIEGAVPLIYPVHFDDKEIDWPQTGKKPNAISVNEQTQKMLYPNDFFTVIRRFSSKEEKQRIVARVINPNKLNFDYIGIENHLNVIHNDKKGLEENLAYGIAAYLNSSLIDTHFRNFSGHTQVNATDIKQLKYPKKQTLIELGIWAVTRPRFDPHEIDEKLRELL